MTHLLDGNVLVALVVEDHIHHRPAEAWLGTDRRFATCPITQGTLLRFLIRNGISASDAASVLQQLTLDERHEFWPDDVGYQEVALTGVVGHRQVTDAYLAHLARSRAAGLATFDQGLAALHGGVAELLDQG